MSTSTLVIGANRGIGLALVKEELKVHPNAKVFATSRDVEKAVDLIKLQEEYGDRLLLLQLDMLDEVSVAKAVLALKLHTDTLELLIVNAGVSIGAGRISSLDSTVFLENLHINVIGPHNILKAFSTFLLESQANKKTVTLISSIVGSVTSLHQLTAFLKNMFKTDYNPIGGYSITKTALNALGRHWAEVLEPQGVAVVLVHPGAVATDMNEGDGLISVEESATGVLRVIAGHKIEDGGRGIFSYDGKTIYPW